MARKPRIHAPGALYHVILRGNNGQSIFMDDTDRYKLQELIAEGADRFGYCLHGYCWMGNHIHAAVRVGDMPLSKLMHHLSFRYTSYFNWRHDRIGHLFAGRYKAILVDSDSYLLQLVRYIHLNPVRAGINPHVDEYYWSSHRAYLGDPYPPWLDPAPVLNQFALEQEKARIAYTAFIGVPVESQHPLDYKKGNCKHHAALGGDAFVRRMLQVAQCEEPVCKFETAEICAAVCTAAGISHGALRLSCGKEAVKARTAAAFLVRAFGDGNLVALAAWLSRDPSTLTRAIARLINKTDDNGVRELAARAGAVLRNAVVQ